jgi:hypothetical protein
MWLRERYKVCGDLPSYTGVGGVIPGRRVRLYRVRRPARFTGWETDDQSRLLRSFPLGGGGDRILFNGAGRSIFIRNYRQYMERGNRA